MPELGRNDPCHCGSKKKYKKCHLEKDEKKDAQKRVKAALNAAKIAEKKAKDEKKPSPPSNPASTPPQKGWFQKISHKVSSFRQRKSP